MARRRAMANFFDVRGVGSAAGGGRVGREDFPRTWAWPGWMCIWACSPGTRGEPSDRLDRASWRPMHNRILLALGIGWALGSFESRSSAACSPRWHPFARLPDRRAVEGLAAPAVLRRDRAGPGFGFRHPRGVLRHRCHRRAAVGSPWRDRGARAVAGCGGASRCDLIGVPIGMINSMATRKVTLSIDHTAWALAEAAAARAGISPSAWLSAAARREAVRLGAGTDWGDAEAEALAYDGDLAAAEADVRAAG